MLLLGVMLLITSSFADFSQSLFYMSQFENSHAEKMGLQNHPSPPIVKVLHPEKNLEVPISITNKPQEAWSPPPTPLPPPPTWTPPPTPLPPPIWNPRRPLIGLTLHDSSLNGLKDSSPHSENVQILSAFSAENPVFQEQYKPKYEETPGHEIIKKTLAQKKYF